MSERQCTMPNVQSPMSNEKLKGAVSALVLGLWSLVIRDVSLIIGHF